MADFGKGLLLSFVLRLSVETRHLVSTQIGGGGEGRGCYDIVEISVLCIVSFNFMDV